MQVYEGNREDSLFKKAYDVLNDVGVIFDHNACCLLQDGSYLFELKGNYVYAMQVDTLVERIKEAIPNLKEDITMHNQVLDGWVENHIEDPLDRLGFFGMTYTGLLGDVYSFKDMFKEARRKLRHSNIHDLAQYKNLVDLIVADVKNEADKKILSRNMKHYGTFLFKNPAYLVALARVGTQRYYYGDDYRAGNFCLTIEASIKKADRPVLVTLRTIEGAAARTDYKCIFGEPKKEKRLSPTRRLRRSALGGTRRSDHVTVLEDWKQKKGA